MAENYFANNYPTVELNKVRYDLALTYATEKLRLAIQSSPMSYSDTEAQYLLEMFGSCFTKYCSLDDEKLYELIDPAYEPL